jgi:Domain of unknown function (DUF4203)
VSDVVVGLIAIAVGALFCLRGYVAMRLIIPMWGAFAGFMFGAGLVAGVGDEAFLRTAAGWLVGLLFALVFGALAYLYYQVAIVLAMASVGFALGVSVVAALGVHWSWAAVLAGTIAGALLAWLAIATDLPAALLVVLTAFAGASAVVFGVMLLVNTVNTSELRSAATTEHVSDDWWWYAIYLVVAIVGVVAQMRHVASLRSSAREQWMSPAIAGP